MKIDAISDLHGYTPRLAGGDLLIIGGDLTGRDLPEEYDAFYHWLDAAPYAHKVVIGGNHDNKIEPDMIDCLRNTHYLIDSGCEIEGLKIWGAPWTMQFYSMNRACMAFTFKKWEEIKAHWDLIPEDLDILVTHGPPKGVLDEVASPSIYGGNFNPKVGDVELLAAIKRAKPRIHIFGHIHENGGKTTQLTDTTFINCSHVNEHYRPAHPPYRFELNPKKAFPVI